MPYVVNAGGLTRASECNLDSSSSLSRENKDRKEREHDSAEDILALATLRRSTARYINYDDTIDA